jgi:hypothetical protein
MHLFPSTEVKVFSDCEHSEFISVRAGSGTHSGICVRDEDDKPWFLVLQSKDTRLVYRLIKPEMGGEVLSFGTDWTLSPYGEQIPAYSASDTAGSFVQTRDGVFISGVAVRDFTDPVLCRLDAPGVWYTLSTASNGFAFPYWRIHYFDQALNKLQKLAANDAPPVDEE